MCARFAVNSRFPSMKMIGVEHLDLGIVWDGAGVGGVSFGRAFDSEGIKSSCSSVKKPSTREMSSIEATRRFNIAKESSSRMTSSAMLYASYATSPEGLPRAHETSNSKTAWASKILASSLLEGKGPGGGKTWQVEVFARKHTVIITASARIVQVIQWTVSPNIVPRRTKCLYLITTINEESLCLEIEFKWML